VLSIVLVVKPAARIDRHIANLVISRGNAEHLPAGAAKFTDRANVVALDHRRDGTDELGMTTNRGIVLIGELIGLARLETSRHGGDSAGKSEHDVLTELGQVLVLSAAEAFPQADQQK